MKNILTRRRLAAVLLVMMVFSEDPHLLKFKHGQRPRAKATNAAVAEVSSLEKVSFAQADDDLQACYKEFLGREPEHDEGQVLFHLTLTANGEVNNLEMVQTDFNEPQFIGCVTEKVRAVRAPASSEWPGLVIAHRFNFHRKDISAMNFD